MNDALIKIMFTIFLIQTQGKLTSRAKLSSSVKELSYCQQRAILVAACDDISLSAYRATSDGALSELGRVKLSGKLVSCDFIAPAVLVSATGDSSLKIWDLQKLKKMKKNQKIKLVLRWKRPFAVQFLTSNFSDLFWKKSRTLAPNLLIDSRTSKTVLVSIFIITPSTYTISPSIGSCLLMEWWLIVGPY